MLSPTAELVGQPAHPIDRLVENRDVGLQADGDLRGIGARDAAAENDDLGRRNTRYSAEQLAEAAGFLFEALRTDLNRHAAGDFAHRREQRQAAVGAVTVSYAIADAPDAINASACARSAARCR